LLPAADAVVHASDVPPNFEQSPTASERQWALFAHLGGLLAMAVSLSSMGFVVPLVIWLLKKDESRFVEDQAKEALNFQISILLANMICAGAGGAIAFITCGLGALLVIPALAAVWVYGLVMPIIATNRVSAGIAYRYPVSFRIVT